MKSYVTFLREASGRKRRFDGELCRKRAVWSSLFWEQYENMVFAEEFDIAGLVKRRKRLRGRLG